MSDSDERATPEATADAGEDADPNPAAVDASAEYPDVPDWDDEYLDRVSDRLMFNYDLAKDHRVGGETYPLYGQMRIESQKQFLHRSINYANHDAAEHLFACRRKRVSVADLERAVERGHELAAEWIDANETHYGTDFTFVFVVNEIPEAVHEFVSGFRDRTLLKLGYYGHYEVNLVVVAPECEDAVASRNADVAQAFVLWEDVRPERAGLLARVLGRLKG